MGSVLVVCHQDDAPPGRLLPALERAGLTAEVCRAGDGDLLPADIGGHAGLVVLGGSVSAWEDDWAPHLRETRALLQDAVARDVPALGICLGAQLAAQALGGEARRGDAGWEVGWIPLVPADPDDPVTAALGDGARLLEWHQDTLVPPPGSVSLLRGGRYEAQGFRFGSLWAVQPHPEVDEEIVRGWCDDPASEGQLRAAETTRDELLGGAREHDRAGASLLEAWAAEVARRT